MQQPADRRDGSGMVITTKNKATTKRKTRLGTADTATDRKAVPHQGMPPFDASGPPISWFEFWPSWLFYVPIYLHWLLMIFKYRRTGLPVVANPRWPMGGMVEDSKIGVFRQLEGHALDTCAPFAWIYTAKDEYLETRVEKDVANAKRAMKDAGLKWPLIVKPDIGCRGQGVRRIRSDEMFAEWLREYPSDEGVVLQEIVNHEAEAGVFYIRLPGEKKGFIFSLTLKYFPWVAGDGVSTLKELIMADPRAGKLPHMYLPKHKERLNWIVPEGEHFRLVHTGAHSKGTIFRNGNPYITDAMAKAFDRIADGIPDFTFGRFDVRFKNIKLLQQGKGFNVLEINGASSEATHIWDRNVTLRHAWSVLWKQWDYLWECGARQARRGWKPPSGWLLLWYLKQEKKKTSTYPIPD